MIRKDNRSEQGAELRRQAEEVILEITAPLPENPESMTPEEIRRQFHELRLHQIELEMQNQELCKAHEELDIVQAHYFDLYNLAPVGYCTLSEQGLILEANLTAATLLGLARTKLFRQPITRFILNEDQTLYYLYHKQHFETGEPQACELRMVKKDKTIFWALLEATAAKNTDNTPVTRIVLSDITKRKRVEDALRASKQVIEGIINAIPVRVFWKDRNLFFLGCNAAFARDAGFADPKDIIGKDDYQMVWRDQAELYRIDDRRVVESGCPKLFIEELQMTPEGNTITLLTSKVPLFNSDGLICGVIGTYMDITEYKRTEEKVRNQLAELLRWQDVMLGREDRVQELKREVNELCRRAGEIVRYPSQEAGPGE